MKIVASQILFVFFEKSANLSRLPGVPMVDVELVILSMKEVIA